VPAALHAQFLEMFQNNSWVQPGALRVLDTPLDLSTITLPLFATGAVADHLTPWPACHRTTQLLSGPSTFVLSNGGHIASLVNLPGNPEASYLADGPEAAGAETWEAGGERHTGSWWEPWAEWVRERSGDERPPPLGPAPGLYVGQLARAAAI
jgi:polyhydroxyalkanoate synthase